MDFATYLTDYSPQTDRPRNHRLYLLGLISILGLIIAWTANTGNLIWAEAVVAISSVAFLVWALKYTTRQPEWLIVPLALIYLCNPIAVFGLETRTIIHYAGVILFTGPALITIYRCNIELRGGFRLFSIYFAWGLLTLFMSLAPEFSLGRLLTSFMGLIIVMAVVCQVKTQKDVYELLFRFASASAVIVAITALAALVLPHHIVWQTPEDGLKPEYVQMLHENGITLPGIDRFRGLFGNANDIGELMLVMVGLAIALWNYARKWGKVVLLGTSMASLIMGVFADSRSSLGGLVIGILLYAIWRYGIRGILISISVIALAFVIVTAAGKTEYISRGDVGTLTGRTDVWAFEIQALKQNLILGYGYEVGGAIFDSRYFPIWYGPWDEGPRSSLHNGYLAHALGVGVPAALLWLFIVLSPWISIARRKTDQWRLKPLFFLLVVPALTLNMTESAMGILWAASASCSISHGRWRSITGL